MQLEHKFALIDQTNIHYVESNLVSGTEAKPTIIFLHGFPEYWGVWRKQLSYFAENYRVIAPDLPGYNLSDKPTEVDFYSVPNLIAFFSKFIKHISPNSAVILVAHDWGGAIAWPLAAFHPQLICKLIILNAAHPSTFTREMVNNPLQRQKSTYIHDLISQNAEHLLQQNNYQYLAENIMVSAYKSTFSNKTKAEYRQVWSQQGGINGMLQYYRAMPQLAAKENTNHSALKQQNNCSSKSEDSGQLSPIKDIATIKIPNIRINLPTLILWGERDQAFVNENLTDINQYVPDCTIVRFKNCSHWLQHERPAEINHVMNHFINT
ncbi:MULTISPECIES: alpha/beta hydrolase [unclassified Shewanella]|uniref:alpha/beta fold hydrolase n=1 Tax=unclassified Shewanella TaxID=196818 RepID=UPI000C836732|nr:MULTISPECIES: alpha/beta hydrolase [unclassified Shewanella]MDO6679975.1 alpha/beta hydrolase [Shewanella sp. 4_MG-2023]PMG39930.1 alpha/beta hydrolase [Shewanella sp. 10N.286.52.B9]PMH97238.1 alpha/beta hydrolase [Shewanella sp. 10N.286.48.A6]